MSRAGSNGPAPGPRPAPPPNPPAPTGVRMWWDGGDRAITAREKALIEEHGPSSFSIPLVRAAATPPAELAEQQGVDAVGDQLLDELRDVEDYFNDVDPNPIHLATVQAAISALAATGKQRVGEVSEGTFRAIASRQTASAESNATAEALISHARAKVGEVQRDVRPIAQALRVAFRHLDMGSMRVSHCKDAAIIESALQEVQAYDLNAAIAALAARQPVEYHGDVDLKWLSGSIGEVAHRLRTYMPHLAEWTDRARDCGIAAKVLEELAARQPGAQEPIELSGIADALSEGGGFWRTCSGCHESNEGVPTGPYSRVMKCHLGTGCSECGGVGAIWDDTDYQAWSDQMAQSLAAPPAPGIDLGPVRDFLRRRMDQWRSHLPSDPGAPGTVAISGDGEGGYNNDVRMYREGIALMDQVLALIDGQRDAAPGVGNG